LWEVRAPPPGVNMVFQIGEKKERKWRDQYRPKRYGPKRVRLKRKRVESQAIAKSHRWGKGKKEDNTRDSVIRSWGSKKDSSSANFFWWGGAIGESVNRGVSDKRVFKGILVAVSGQNHPGGGGKKTTNGVLRI